MGKLIIMAIISTVVLAGALVSIDSVTARENSIETIHYSTYMPSDFITISPGETRIVNATVVSDSPANLRLKMAVTQYGDEINHMLGGPTKDIGSVTASILENSIDIREIRQPGTIHEDSVSVIISASDDAESGTYPFSFVLHHERAGPDTNSVTYFYVIVE
ncbi:MAG: hypothetical protein OXI27_01415 [Thaumarchaeota archaeon]|nr:hypothetical protein [Nitrososphaerota archaeon]